MFISVPAKHKQSEENGLAYAGASASNCVQIQQTNTSTELFDVCVSNGIPLFLEYKNNKWAN